MNQSSKHSKAKQISTLVNHLKMGIFSNNCNSNCSHPIRLLLHHHLLLFKSLGFLLESALHSLPQSLKLSHSHLDLSPINNSNTFNHNSNSHQSNHKLPMYPPPWIHLLNPTLMLLLTQRINPFRQKYLAFCHLLHLHSYQHHLRLNSIHSNSNRIAR